MISTSERVRSQDNHRLSKSADSSVVVCDAETQQPGPRERHELVKLLRGQQLRVPDLQSFLQAWPEATNINVAALRVEVDQFLDKYQHL